MMIQSSIAPTIVLPRMTAGELTAMILALETSLHAVHPEPAAGAAHTARKQSAPRAAPSMAIPAQVVACAARLVAARRALTLASDGAVSAREAEAAARASRALRRGHYNRCKRAWTAFYAMLGAWREAGALVLLPDASRAAMDRVVPPTGAPNLRRRALALWNDGARQLAQLERSGASETVAALGGAAVYAHLRATHDALGTSLGIAKPVEASTARPGRVSPALTHAASALRDYVLKVYGMADDAVEGSADVAAALLAPLLDLAASHRARPAAAKTPQPEVAPAAPAPANDDASAVKRTG